MKMSDMQTMIADSAQRLFPKQCDKTLLERFDRRACRRARPARGRQRIRSGHGGRGAGRRRRRMDRCVADPSRGRLLAGAAAPGRYRGGTRADGPGRCGAARRYGRVRSPWSRTAAMLRSRCRGRGCGTAVRPGRKVWRGR
jgi:hypothetical protein